MVTLGIDPGVLGGMVWLDDNANIIRAIKMPETPMDILDALTDTDGADTVCYLEDVGQGIPGQSSKATATFARHNGHLEMALMAMGIPTIKVRPQKWQKALGLLSRPGDTKQKHKNAIKAWVQLLYPTQKVTLTLADAIAIARYGYSLK